HPRSALVDRRSGRQEARAPELHRPSLAGDPSPRRTASRDRAPATGPQPGLSAWSDPPGNVRARIELAEDSRRRSFVNMKSVESLNSARSGNERSGTFGSDPRAIQESIRHHLQFTLAELPEHVDSRWEPYVSLALAVRDRLIENWVRTHESYYE